MQCCEFHGKGVRTPKKAKYHAGVAVKNRIAGLCQANCSYSEIYKTLKAEEIPISLSAIKIISQCFETTGNVARKKWCRRPKASSCRDDHLLKCTVLKGQPVASWLSQWTWTCFGIQENIACFPQLKSCFLKRNNQTLFFDKIMLTLQRPPNVAWEQIHQANFLAQIWTL